MDVVLNSGIIILAGVLAAWLLSKLKLPKVLSYIVVGAFLGRSVANIVSPSIVRWEEIISVVALGFIAFLIGDTFRWKNIVEIGTRGIIVSLLESTLTAVIVGGGFLIVPISLLLGACAAATAPAATFMVVNYLLMAVTFDDAVGIILFDISVVIVRVLLKGGGLSIGEAIFANFSINAGNIFSEVENWIFPILLFFFVLSGSDLDMTLLPNIKNLFPELSYITTIVLSTVVLFEIIGPLGAKYAIFGAGEVKTHQQVAKEHT